MEKIRFENDFFAQLKQTVWLRDVPDFYCVYMSLQLEHGPMSIVSNISMRCIHLNACYIFEKMSSPLLKISRHRKCLRVHLSCFQGPRKVRKGRTQISRTRNDMDLREKGKPKCCGLCKTIVNSGSKCLHRNFHFEQLSRRGKYKFMF